ncbi:MAG: hemolysin family protein [Acidimicrobiales bacterium]
MATLPLLGAIGLIVANGFFVAAEFALVGSRRVRLEPLANQGSRRATIALKSIRDLNTQLAAAQLGVTISSIGLGLVGEPVVARAIEGVFEGVVGERVLELVSFGIALTIVAFFHMLLGEMVPKGVAIAEPEKFCLWLAPPLRVIAWLGTPLIWSLNFLAAAGLRLLGRSAADELKTAVTPRELQTMFAESRRIGEIDPEEHNRLSLVLSFRDVTARVVMVPRSEIRSMSRQATVAQLEHTIRDSKHSRLPLTGKDLDEVLGFVHGKDLLQLPISARQSPVPVRMIRPMIRLSPEASLPEMLRAMRLARTHLGVVQDEGVTLGIVSLDDVLGRLVGRIADAGFAGTGDGSAANL